jgi:predicted transcriptional regulator
MRDDEIRGRVQRLARDLRDESDRVVRWAAWPTRTAHQREQAAARAGDLVHMALRVEACAPTFTTEEG